MKTGIELIKSERERQIEDEGATTEHDDQHGSFELSKAARAYAKTAELMGFTPLFWRQDGEDK